MKPGNASCRFQDNTSCSDLLWYPCPAAGSQPVGRCSACRFNDSITHQLVSFLAEGAPGTQRGKRMKAREGLAAGVNRRRFLGTGPAALAAAGAAWSAGRAGFESPEAAHPFELEEITVRALQDGMRSGRFTAKSIARMYLERIEKLDRRGAGGPAVNAVIEINPDALSIAEDLDRERREQGARGPLHGVPVLIKDNIATADRMMTTAGSLALVGSIAPRDSFVAQRLLEAGAVILGKTNLSEWANFRSGHSTSGWSGRGGQTLNPYALDRNPCGSSSGSGAAASANLCAIA